VNDYYTSPQLGTGATCHETTGNFTHVLCGNFVEPRTFSVNGTPISCQSASNVLPPKVAGGYCFQASAGQQSFAYFTTWIEMQ